MAVHGLATDHSGRVRPRGLAWARRTRRTSLDGVRQVLGDRHRAPVRAPALERRAPELGRGEIRVTGADRERLAHPAPGERQRPSKGLHRRPGVGPDRGEEAIALFAGQIFPPAMVVQGDVGALGHGVSTARRPAR